MVGGLEGSPACTSCAKKSSEDGLALIKTSTGQKQKEISTQESMTYKNSIHRTPLLPSKDNSVYPPTTHNGGASSAWRSSVYSRGPVNYPNNGWYNGEKQFKQFTKTGQYIPNTELPYAAAPISTGAVKDDNPIQGTVSDYLSQYAAYGSGKKKKTSTKKKKTPTKKKKTSTKKKKTSTKKKKTPTKKKKTTTKKKKTSTKKKKTQTKKKYSLKRIPQKKKLKKVFLV